MNLLDIFSFNNKKKEVNKRSSVNVNYIATKANKYTSITNPDTALTNSVIYRGISILTDSVATIPIDIYHKNKQTAYEDHRGCRQQQHDDSAEQCGNCKICRCRRDTYGDALL